MKTKKVQYRYISKDVYEVKYDRNLFKFGALFYIDDLGYIGTQEESSGWIIKILNDSAIAATNSKYSPVVVYPSEEDTMLLPTWAYDILDPKPTRTDKPKVELFSKEEVDEWE